MAGNDLASYLANTGVLKTPVVTRAFKAVSRKEFLPEDLKNLANLDRALPIAEGQTNSQPYTVAFMLELLDPKPGHRILDVGSGSGWTTALLAYITGSKGSVKGLEIVDYLVKFGQDNLRKFRFPWANIKKAPQATFGLEGDEPYDRILVSAAAREIPDVLLSKLNSPGKMVIPIQNDIVLASKNKSGQVRLQTFSGFVFVPLINHSLT